MKVGVIGAGFVGLSAAYRLSQQGHEVIIFEKDTEPGGLAIGYQEKGWDWPLEKHYHHWFTNDNVVLDLAKEIHYPVLTLRPKTSSFVDAGIYQLDSPLTLLQFPKLTLLDRIRTGLALALLRYNPFWHVLERFRAQPYLEAVMGKTAYKKIWEPLLVNKLGTYAHSVSLAWFWARVYKRTTKLAYPQGGFLTFANALVKEIEKKEGKAFFATEVTELYDDQKVRMTIKRNGKTIQETFDHIIITTPSSLFIKIAPQLPETYKKSLGHLVSIGAINMVLRLKTPFFSDNTYWLNICSRDFPILAIVEHTNFIDKKHYHNEHLIYVGNYVPHDHVFFSKTKEELLTIYDPFLKTINPGYKKALIGYEVFKAPFAQPIIPPNYSKMIPSMHTPLPHVSLANIEQVYPWDRGTNYAVALGQTIAEKISNEV